MEFPVMSRASGQACPDAHRFSGTATGAMARMFAACSRVRCSKRWPPTLQGAVQPAPTRTPVPDGLSRHASRVIAAGTARWSHPYRRPCPRRNL